MEGFTRKVYFLVQPCRNRPAEFARCPRCPPGACQRRLPIAAPDMLGFMAESLGTCRGRCPHRLVDLSEDSNFLGQPHRNRPAEFARSSLSAWGLPTPLVALACIGNVSIQVFSGVGGQCYFVRRLQAYSYKPPLKGEGDQRSWWRGLPPQQPTGFTKSYASFFLY